MPSASCYGILHMKSSCKAGIDVGLLGLLLGSSIPVAWQDRGRRDCFILYGLHQAKYNSFLPKICFKKWMLMY